MNFCALWHNSLFIINYIFIIIFGNLWLLRCLFCSDVVFILEKKNPCQHITSLPVIAKALFFLHHKMGGKKSIKKQR